MPLTSYENRVWPSNGSLRLSEIDSFADLRESLTLNPQNEAERAFAQYYNKLAGAINTAQSLISFSAAASSGTGIAGQPVYTPTCPNITPTIGAISDGTITSITTPYCKKILVSDLFDTISTVSTALSPQVTTVLPWEFVLTTDLTTNYSNSTSQDFIVQSADVWSAYIEGKTVHAAAWLEPILDPFTSGDTAWFNLWTLNWYVIKNSTHFIIRGSIFDNSTSVYSTRTENAPQWLSTDRGAKVKLCVSFFGVS